MPSQRHDIAVQCSPFLDSLISRHNDWFEALKEQGRLENTTAPAPETLDKRVKEHDLDAGLRIFRNQEMMRIVWRELNREASLEETMLDLSVLAQVCLQCAVLHHDEQLTQRFGTPTGSDGVTAQLAVISMGKLGGFELNLSSDIDLVFTYTQQGECDGRRRLSNEQFFTRLVRQVIASLSEVTEHGFCFRVDTRITPVRRSRSTGLQFWRAGSVLSARRA